MRRPEFLKLKEKRARNRLGLTLEDRALAPSTRSRYAIGVLRVLDRLEDSRLSIDEALADWIEDRYAEGEGVTTVADTLSGLHHYSPALKGALKRSWRLFQLWRRLDKRPLSLNHSWKLWLPELWKQVILVLLCA